MFTGVIPSDFSGPTNLSANSPSPRSTNVATRRERNVMNVERT